MALNKVKLGDYIELYSEKCNISNLTPDEVSGVNRDKEFFEPSKQVGNNTSNYKVVPPNYFACNLMHIGRDVVLPIALNDTVKNKIVSPAYTIFKLKDERTIIKEFLFIFLKSPEIDRFFWFHCDSSVRDGMDWSTFCDIEIDLPPIEIQRKYVAIYKGLKDNLKVYQSKLDDLKLVYEGYIEKNGIRKQIGDLISEVNKKNINGLYKLEKGVSIEKKFISTKASSSDISKQKIVDTNTFAFNSNTSRNSDTISIALNLGEPCIVSNTYVTFRVDETKVNPKYLFLWFRRKEFDRFARFNSWGSARETLSIDEIKEYKINLPTLGIQNNIVKILDIYFNRKLFVDKLKQTINGICPILIRGAIKEANDGVD